MLCSFARCKREPPCSSPSDGLPISCQIVAAIVRGRIAYVTRYKRVKRAQLTVGERLGKETRRVISPTTSSGDEAGPNMASHDPLPQTRRVQAVSATPCILWVSSMARPSWPLVLAAFDVWRGEYREYL